ncbi:unnamed protein product [Ceutorhynchus assimilis]|uniref:Leucine-rich repeat-containing protein 59 n=1 Tax=Ceutorhynchus assimilis TaxID=467358 RepID=A0A9N9MU81_9CUCU|nr:unnamed protein product [Ceutorhynchus assimilis]
MSQKQSKINVKERFSDGEIDLSMSDLDEVPVKEIASLKKTHSLDLSNNRLTSLPNNFTIITFLTKLDLSKNELTELPEDFGKLSKLKYLDLYKNSLERLPLSFGQLNNLKFLDLKDNPLIPTIAKVAGPCVDTKGCQQCARDVVKFFRQLQEEVDSEVEMRKKARQKQLEVNQQKKQEEKKKLKKENKQIKINNKEVAQANIINGNMKKKNKKEQKKSNKPQLQSNFSLIKTFMYLFILSLIIVWFMFALNSPLTSSAVPQISYYFDTFLNKLPTDYRQYGETFANKIVMLQNNTRHYTEVVYNSETVRNVFGKINQIVEDVLSKK